MAIPIAVQRSITQSVSLVGESLAETGRLTRFSAQVLTRTITDVVARLKYRKVVLQHISDIVVGVGGWVVGGGMLFVLAAMAGAVGATLGLGGYKGLEPIGAEGFTGIVASFGNVREMTPIITAVAMAAQVGASFTAEIGAMRISDEIDALEVMGIPSLVYLVCTRVVAVLIALVPLYLFSLFMSFFAARFVTTQLFGLSTGLYDYYFQLYLPPIDVFYSLVKVLTFAVLITIIHCYYGYTAKGGPAGVGLAVGRAIRLSLIVVVMMNLFLSYVFWGNGNTISLTG